MTKEQLEEQNGGPSGEGLFNQEAHIVRIAESVRESGRATPELIAEAISYLQRDGMPYPWVKGWSATCGSSL